MATTTHATSRIDPDAIELPQPMARQVQAAFDLPIVPESYGAWADGIVNAVGDARDRSISTDDLCDVESSPHAATVGGETTNYLCAQDPLLVGLLADEPVTVESTPPNRDTPVRFEFADDGTVTVEPEGALLSFGVATDVDRPRPATPAAFYELVCPYGHAFPDDDAYEAWAADTDAVTDVLSARAGVAVMDALLTTAGLDSLG